MALLLRGRPATGEPGQHERAGAVPQGSVARRYGGLTCLTPHLGFNALCPHLSGYYGDGMYDVIVFSSCYLPQNRLENYQNVMDHLFR